MTMQGVAPVVPLDSLVPSPESFGAKEIDDSILQNYAKVTGKPAPTFLRRKIFNGHIDFDDAIERKHAGKPFYIFLSITPTNRLTNLRHIVTFSLAKQLQEAFDCPVVIHVLDSKAFLRDPDVKFDVVQKMTEETIKDIISFKFIPEKTVIIKNTDALNMNYVYLCDLQRKSSLGSFVEKFVPNDNVSISVLDVVYQNLVFSIPEYLQRIFSNYEQYRCLMILRPSQKNMYDYISSMTESSIDPKYKPMALFGGFVPALQGGEKMPTLAKFAQGQNSNGDSNADNNIKGKKTAVIRDYMTIYLSNTTKEVAKKLNSSAFSGGRDTLALQQEKGANIDVDVAFYYLKLFEEDDEKLMEIRRTYGPGDLPEGNDKRMTTGALKKVAADTIAKVVTQLQEARKMANSQSVFTTIRLL